MQGLVQKRARDSKDPPRTIIGNAIETVNDDTKPLIRRSLTARNIRNTRHVARLEPANPKSLAHLKIPKEFKMLGLEVFMKYDGWNGDERIQLENVDEQNVHYPTPCLSGKQQR
uniref:Uncharacterized protein n=1 Tax=Ditylenchus dipsaci TaxID=166011 RepID=A0A915DZU5_9BILA